MKKSLITISVLIFVLLASVVIAQPPFQESGGTNTLQIEVAIPEYFIQRNDFVFHAHVYNRTDGLLMTNATTSCTLHLYNHSGNHIVQTNMDWDSNNIDFDKTISGNNFTKTGIYHYLIQCNTTTTGGFIARDFEVTQTGLENNVTDSTGGIAIVLFTLLITFGLIILPYKIDFSKRGWLDQLIKRGCWVTALFLLGLTSAIVATIAEANNIRVTSELFRFMWLVHKAAWLLLIYTIYEYFVEMMDQLNQKKRNKRMGLE